MSCQISKAILEWNVVSLHESYESYMLILDMHDIESLPISDMPIFTKSFFAIPILSARWFFKSQIPKGTLDLILQPSIPS